MDSGDQVATILIEIPNIPVFRLIGNQRVRQFEGSLKIGHVNSQNLYFMNISDFFFNITKQTPFIVVPFETHKTYVFPNLDQGFNAIVINKAVDSSDQLDVILTTIATLIDQQQAESNDQLKAQLDQHCSNIFNQSLIDDSKAIYYIAKTGFVLNTGFKWLGKKISDGIQVGGQYVQSKISNENKPVEVNPETKQKFDNIKDKAKSTMKVTGDFLHKFFKPIAEKTNEIVNDVSQKIDQGDSSTLKAIKTYTIATGNAINTAVQGGVSGLKEVGGALKTNTQQIVEKKYGEQVVNAYIGGNPDQQKQNQQQQMQQPQQQQYVPLNETQNQ